MPENDIPQQDNKKRKLSLGEIALIIQGTAAGAILLELLLLTYISYIGWILFLPAALSIFALPIIGIIMGIIALCVKEYHSLKNNVCAAIAIILPIITVGIIILLASARVIVIHLM